MHPFVPSCATSSDQPPTEQGSSSRNSSSSTPLSATQQQQLPSCVADGPQDDKLKTVRSDMQGFRGASAHCQGGSSSPPADAAQPPPPLPRCAQVLSFPVPAAVPHTNRRPLRQAIKECELRWFHETAALAQEGEAQQMVLLGHMYTVGYGCKPNPDEASKWFDEASKLLGYNVRSDPAPIMSSVGPPGLLQQQQPDQHRHHHHHHHYHHSSHHHSSNNQTHEQQQQQPAPHAPQLQHLSSYGLSPSSSRAAAAAAGGGSSSHQQQQLFSGSMPPHPAAISPAAAAAAAAAGASVTAG